MTVEASPSWDSYLAGTLAPGAPLPLWHLGTIDTASQRQIDYFEILTEPDCRVRPLGN